MRIDLRAYNKAWRLAHPKQIKKANKKYRMTHPEKIKETNKNYRVKNAEKCKVYYNAHYLANIKKERERSKKYRLTHRKQTIRATRKWKLANPEKIKKTRERFYASPKGKMLKQKGAATRRQLGFIPLNKPFKGSAGHHINLKQIIQIPKELHDSIWHSVIQNINMEKINRLAVEFLRREA